MAVCERSLKAPVDATILILNGCHSAWIEAIETGSLPLLLAMWLPGSEIVCTAEEHTSKSSLAL